MSMMTFLALAAACADPALSKPAAAMTHRRPNSIFENGFLKGMRCLRLLDSWKKPLNMGFI